MVAVGVVVARSEPPASVQSNELASPAAEKMELPDTVRLVVVALVEVASVLMRLRVVMVPVAVIFATLLILPLKSALPCTENFAPGDVVPTPTLPFLSMRMRSVALVLLVFPVKNWMWLSLLPTSI